MPQAGFRTSIACFSRDHGRINRHGKRQLMTWHDLVHIVRHGPEVAACRVDDRAIGLLRRTAIIQGPDTVNGVPAHQAGHARERDTAGAP